ncbi:uncharacterized protein LOC129577090 [Sitodiplosis mosellana]|uniref:uncharacterized protein LOC129577090 n=1 Tax=Sitodiplosis mosellana TaxID=263140 RepID=UPI002444FD03|nr:uncharacterized protein LOC129577090 [Sitodiplosis mosellana]
MSKPPCDIKKTVANLLRAPYPFPHEHHRTIYEQCGRMFFTQINLYRCNFCKIKLLGEPQLLDHNKSFGHQTEMEKEIAVRLKKSTIEKKVTSIKLSGKVKEKLASAAVQAAQMKLNEAMAELKNEYELYRLSPALHPMYAKEWQVYYLRRLSDILAINIDPREYDFTKDWSMYWVQRIQVYYNEAMQKVINTIGANYKLTLDEMDLTGASQTDNAQHCANGDHINKDHGKSDSVKDNLANGARMSEDRAYVDRDLGGNDSVNDDKSNNKIHADNFSITNGESISTVNNDNVIEIDSAATTEDEASECEFESGSKNRSKTDNGSESECGDDVATSRFRLPLPQNLIDEALSWAKDESSMKSQEDSSTATITTAKEPSNEIKENDAAIDFDAVADSVLSFFQTCGLNPANLSDEQVQQYIEYIVKSTPKPANDRAGSVETLMSSDSNDDSWRYV